MTTSFMMQWKSPRLFVIKAPDFLCGVQQMLSISLRFLKSCKGGNIAKDKCSILT